MIGERKTQASTFHCHPPPPPPHTHTHISHTITILCCTFCLLVCAVLVLFHVDSTTTHYSMNAYLMSNSLYRYCSGQHAVI